MMIVVSAAVIERDDAFLLTRRLKGTHLEGTWEFPGGKCEPGETPAACLVRELREELAVDAMVGELLLVTRHAYPERSVELHFFRADVIGAPSPQLGQQMRWVPREELATLELPDADADLIRLLVAELRTPTTETRRPRKTHGDPEQG
jgi:8-oxo-dGTP diphosphatase